MPHTFLNTLVSSNSHSSSVAGTFLPEKDKRRDLGCMPTYFNPECLMIGKSISIKLDERLNIDQLPNIPLLARIWLFQVILIFYKGLVPENGSEGDPCCGLGSLL